MYFVTCSTSEMEASFYTSPNVSEVRLSIQLRHTVSISEAGSALLIVAEVAPFKQPIF